MAEQTSPVTPPRLEVLGTPVNNVTMHSALDHARHMLERPGAKLVLATNPEKVIAARRSPPLLRALRGADLVIPDGIGVVLAARLRGARGIARVPGSEMMPALCGLAASEGHPVFLYGARQAVVSKAAALLQQQYPGLIVAGTQHGYVDDSDMPALIDSINASGARILFVGLGSPRQELWMIAHRHLLEHVRLIQGVGGTFDAICGHPPRAPALWRRLNLEWLYRLLSQPARIHRQRALPLFAARVLQEVLFHHGKRT